MSILNYKSTHKIIKLLSESIRINKFKSNEIPKFIFVCGKQIIDESGVVSDSQTLDKAENKRQFLINSLSSKQVICAISEKIYDNKSIVDTLTFEELLAELSEEIIIIVESPGTLCELGAFTVKDKFLKKLIVINDKAFRDQKSFINEGPVKKIIMYSEERYLLVENDYKMFKNDFLLKSCITKIKNQELQIVPNNDFKKIDLKYLIYELMNIIELFAPLEKMDLFTIYKSVKSFDSFDIENREKHQIRSYTQIIDLMIRMELIKVEKNYINKNADYTYYNSLFNISRDEFNKLRAKRIYSLRDQYQEQIWSENNDIRVNE
ncbi:MAG: retron St85 family effector protein [Sarcina sp.]